jgi:hypothetical protein
VVTVVGCHAAQQRFFVTDKSTKLKMVVYTLNGVEQACRLFSLGNFFVRYRQRQLLLPGQLFRVHDLGERTAASFRGDILFELFVGLVKAPGSL